MSVLGSLFSAPKAPSYTPPTPTPVPTPATAADATSSAQLTRGAAASAAGLASTVKTGPGGAAPTTPGYKSLLGA